MNPNFRRLGAIIFYSWLLHQFLLLPVEVVKEFFEFFKPFVGLLIIAIPHALFAPARHFYWSGLTPDDKIQMAKSGASTDAGVAAMVYLAQNGMRAVAISDVAGRFEMPPAPTAVTQKEKVTYLSPKPTPTKSPNLATKSLRSVSNLPPCAPSTNPDDRPLWS